MITSFVPQGDPKQVWIVVLAVLSAVLSFAVTVLWMYLGWRAMRAHERLPSAIEGRLPPSVR